MEKFESIEIIIGEDKINERIDKVLSSHPLIASRSRAVQLIESGHVKINKKLVKPSYKVSIGEHLHIEIPLAQKSGLSSYNIDLDIVYEDSDVIVVNKPAGLVVHPSKGHSDKTLVNALIHHTKDLSMGFGEDRPGIIHRLDKETSGLLVVAKNNSSQDFLAQQFKDRKIHRIYWAVVLGELSQSSEKIETLIGRHPTDRKKFSSKVKDGKIAITNYRVLNKKRKLSLIEVKLETGRTHQIRVHMSDKGHPVFGDGLYGAKNKSHMIEAKELKELNMNFGRIALHAKELGFIHPKTKTEMRFNYDPPEEFQKLLTRAALI